LGVRAKRFAFGASEKPANEIQQALIIKKYAFLRRRINAMKYSSGHFIA
jgi:hypothetical protein